MTVTFAPVPTAKSPLLEPSFADAIAIIATAEGLPAQTRLHWATSLRRIAKLLDKPRDGIPARYSAVWPMLVQLHPVRTNLKPKTLQNHKSNVKSALLWLARAKGVPRRGMPLAAPWEELRARLGPGIPRWTFSLLMRFCTARGVMPAAVDEAVIDRYMAYRAQTGKASDTAFRRGLARAWNSNVGRIEGWPAHRLLEPPLKTAGKPTWDAFPVGAAARCRALPGNSDPCASNRKRTACPAAEDVLDQTATCGTASRGADGREIRAADRAVEFIGCPVGAGHGGEDLGCLLAAKR